MGRTEGERREAASKPLIKLLGIDITGIEFTPSYT
jgi:hypothetical protein